MQKYHEIRFAPHAKINFVFLSRARTRTVGLYWLGESCPCCFSTGVGIIYHINCGFYTLSSKERISLCFVLL